MFLRHLKSMVCLAVVSASLVFNHHALADINVETAPDFFVHHEIVIDRPAEDVWKYLIDMKTWIVSHQVEHFSGEPHTKGFVMKFTPNGYLSVPEKDRPARSNHFGRALRYVENKNFLHTGYSYNEGSYGSFVFKDYVDFRLRESNGKTRLILNGMGLVGGDMSQEQVDQMSASSSQAMKVNIENLKKVVEASR